MLQHGALPTNYPDPVIQWTGVTKHHTGSAPAPNIGLSGNASTSSIPTALRSRGNPVGRRSLSLVRFAVVARSAVDCQCAIGRFSLFSWIDQKQSCFGTQNIPILGAGAESVRPVRCVVTPFSEHKPQLRQKLSYTCSVYLVCLKLVG